MSSIKDFKRSVTVEPSLSKLQDNLDTYLTPITACPLIDGVLLKNVRIVSGQVNNIDHKLQREPLGWIVVRKRANATIWDSQNSNTFKSKTLALHASTTLEIDLWVF